MLLGLFVITCVSGQLIEYQFYRNYGQIIFDFSFNELHGVNGKEVGPDSRDCFFTDRGVFLAQRCIISIAKTSSDINMRNFDKFSLVFWLKSYESEGLSSFFSSSGSSNPINLMHDSKKKSIVIYLKDKLKSSFVHSEDSSFEAGIPYIGKWTLINFEMDDSSTLLAIINEKVIIKMSTNDNYQESGPFKDPLLGDNFNLYSDTENSIYKGLQGFLWYFALWTTNSINGLYLNTDDLSCLIGLCRSCDSSFTIPKIGNSCELDSNDLDLDSNEKPCILGEIFKKNLKECNCSSNSCLLTSSRQVSCIFAKLRNTQAVSGGDLGINYESSGNKSAESSVNCKQGVLREGKCVCSTGMYYDSKSESCRKCLSSCLSCTDIKSCTECVNSHSYPPDCSACHELCLTCSGGLFYQCLTCSNYLLGKICVDICPLGFTSLKNDCIQSSQDKAVLDFEFKEVSSVYIDSAQNISAHKKLLRPGRLLVSEPYSEYKRGVYFTGDGFLQVDEKNLMLFALDFTLSLWLKPEKDTNVLLSRFDDKNNKTCLKIWLNKTFAMVKLTFENETELNTSFSLQIKTWNHFYLRNEYSLMNNVQAGVNGDILKTFTLSDSPFVDSNQGLLLIGSDADPDHLFKGFLYSLQIFNSIVPPNYFLSTTGCSSCSLCLTDKSCLNTCDPKKFYSDEDFSCFDCEKNCPLGCKNNKTCNLCLDQNCRYCPDYLSEGCSECLVNFEKQGDLCVPCNQSAFYDAASKTCKACPELCTSCESEKVCKSCSTNSSLQTNHLCACNQGFYHDRECKLKTFSASLTVSQQLVATIWFTEPLLHSLKASDISVYVENKSVDFSLTRLESDRFQVEFKFKEVKPKLNLQVEFKKSIYSENLETLENQFLKYLIVMTSQQKKKFELNEKAEYSESVASTGAVAGLLFAFGMSIFQVDLRSFFDFLNTAEIFYSVSLYDINLNPILDGFLSGIRIPKKLPKISENIIGKYSEEHLDSKYRLFGYRSNLFILNAEIFIETLVVIFSLLLVLSLLSFIKFLQPKLRFLMNYFKYSIFLRFWIQSFLEILVALGVAIKYKETWNLVQIIDISICGLVIVKTIQIAKIFLFALLLYLVLKKSRLISNEDNQKQDDKFRTFFIDFKENHYKNWLFYVIFIVRRVFIVLSIEITSGLPQIIFPTMLSFTVISNQNLFYLATTRCFKKPLLNAYHLMVEFFIVVYYSILIYACFSDDGMTEMIAYICIYTIIVTWAVCVVFSIYLAVLKTIDTSRLIISKFKTTAKVQDIRPKEINVSHETQINPFTKIEKIGV